MDDNQHEAGGQQKVKSNRSGGRFLDAARSAMRTALVTVLVLCGVLPYCVPAAEVTATIGPQDTVIPAGQYGFNAFPDGAISVLNEKSPVTYLLTVGWKGSSVLMRGPSFEKALPVKVVIGPSKTSGAYDEQYAGFCSIYFDKKRREILGFFHAEKPTGGRNSSGIVRFYASVGLAASKDGGMTFDKIGPVLTGRPENPNWKGTAQGNAGGSVCVDHTGQWLYLYYTEHSRRDPATNKKRSVITCMARSRVNDGGRPGTWHKYYEGEFLEPGLGGKDTEIADCWAASVTYVPEIKKYIMIGCRGAIVFFISDDGIHWRQRTPLWIVHDVRLPQNANEPVAGNPTIRIAHASANRVTGHLLYSFSPNQNVPPYFVKRQIALELGDGSNKQTTKPKWTPKTGEEVTGDAGRHLKSLAKRLAGTKWINSNGVTFEWTADGRFLHNGTERQCNVLDERRVQIVFGANHIDTLEFDDGLTTFRQLIRGGPRSFTGKRQ